MKSLIKRILGVPEVELVDEEPERYCARVAVQKNEPERPQSAVRLVDEDTGYDPYDRINGAG